MNEEELKAKAEELERKEGELQKLEEELKEREAAISRREADASSIAQAIKEEYEKKLAAQQAEFEERLKQRDEVIRQLASGDGKPAEDDNNPFAQLNKKRIAQLRN